MQLCANNPRQAQQASVKIMLLNLPQRLRQEALEFVAGKHQVLQMGQLGQFGGNGAAQPVAVQIQIPQFFEQSELRRDGAA